MSTLLIDCGCANTRIVVDGELVFDQPTCMAVHAQSESVVSYGDKALALLGKVGADLRVTFPVMYGMPTSYTAASRYFDAVIKEHARPALWRRMFAQPVVLTYSGGSSPASTTAWQRVFSSIGCSVKKHVFAPAAAANTVSAKLDAPLCILVIGAQMSSIAVVRDRAVVASASIRWGGARITEILQSELVRIHQLRVGWSTTEKLKKQVHLFSSSSHKSMVVEGRDAIGGRALKVDIDTQACVQPVRVYLAELEHFIAHFFSQISTQLATSVLQNGIFLAGGTAQLIDVPQHLSSVLGCRVEVVPHPSFAAIKGLQVQYEA
ncbi:MAG: rod shape-determining protein [Pseudomonadales bacterium]|nr:rod shape-determining protein [Pseudomonadales bacterium]